MTMHGAGARIAPWTWSFDAGPDGVLLLRLSGRWRMQDHLPSRQAIVHELGARRSARVLAHLADFAVGVTSASVFGVLVAVAGCLRGMQSGRSSAAVGQAATSAVVTGIVFIVTSDALLTVIYDVLGL